MFIPTIYTDNVALLFSSLLLAFGVIWGIFKAIRLIKS